MSITRIKSYGISDGAITTNKISGDVSLGVKISNVQIANSSYSVLDDTAVALEGGYLVITGSGFASGCQVIVGANTATSTTFVNSTTIRAQVGAADAGTKTIYVVNTDGGTAIRVNGLTYSATPTWVTGSTLSDAGVDEAISIQLSANDATSYQLQTGSTLPTGLSLAANGLLSGTVTGIEEETIYNFTIEAIDDENQESPRTFSITITSGEQYFYATTLLLNGDGANGANNNTFVDSSNNNFAITRNGNVTQGSFSPFSAPDGRWSNYFGTNTSNLIFASNAAFNIGTGNFTVEGFVNFNAWSGTNQRLFLQGVNGTDNISVGRDSGSNNLLVRIQNSTIITYSWTPNIGQWYHIAVVRSGTGSDQVALYIDGVSVATGTSSASIAQNQFIVGGLNWATGYNIQGYLSNVRYSNNARINSLPTVPYSSDVNTLLLTCQSNRFKDNSTNNFTITPNGNVSVTSFAPFAPTGVYSAETNGGSGYFDGSGDYLTTPTDAGFAFGTGDYTMSCWIYPTTTTQRRVFRFSDNNDNIDINVTSAGTLNYYNGSTSTTSATTPIRTNEWNYISIVRLSGTVKGYVNGVEVLSTGSTPNTTSNRLVNVGGATSEFFSGYISNVRMVKGTAITPTSAPTSLETAVSGTELLLNFTNAGILDYTAKNNLETVGNAQISTSVKKYGTGSMAFDGTGDYLQSPSNDTLALGGGNFTIECWIYPAGNSNYMGFYQNHTDGNGRATALRMNIYQTDNTRLMVQTQASSLITTASGVMTANAWNHIALVRNGSGSNNLVLYVNGTSVGTATNTTNFSDSFAQIGNARYAGVDYVWNGYIDDLRITKGIARYTSNFTPPTSAHRLR